DPAATEGYFIGVGTTTFGTLWMRRISTPGGTPSISANLLISVPTTTTPINAPQSSGATALDALDDRLFYAPIHKNPVTGVSSLWTAHNIEVNSSGVGAAGGGRDGSRWYQIDNFTSTPTLTQSGTLFDPAATNPMSYWIPSCVMTGQGHMALGSS